MGQVPWQNLVWLFVLNVPWPFAGVGGMPVEVTVGRNPVQTGVGWNTTLSVSTTSKLYSVEWRDPAGSTILTLISGQLFIKTGTRYTDRVRLQSNGSLTIGSAALADEGNYSVEMEPPSGQGVTTNTLTIRLLVYEPVTGVTVTMSQDGAPEGTQEVSLSCTSLSGTRISYSWLKDARPLVNSSRIRLQGNAVRIQQLQRADAGQYTCVVGNAISSGSQSQRLTVYYGPESVVVSQAFQSDCVTPHQVILGRSGTLSCRADSVPPANYSWSLRGQALVQGSTVTISSLTSNDSGLYTCTASNVQTKLERTASSNIVGVAGCLNVGGTVGIVIAGVVVLALLIALVVWLVMRRKNANALPKKQSVVERSREVEAKVLPWINRHHQQRPGFSTPPPLDSRGPIGTYSSYPPSTGSMVPSTLNRGVSCYRDPLPSGQLSTLF